MFKLRRYEPRDFESVWQLHTEALDTIDANARDSYFADLKNIEGSYLQAGGDFVVGEVQDRIVAMGGLKRTSPDRAEIMRMRVHPDFQRQGFGGMILRFLEKGAAELGYRIVHFDTLTKQLQAQQFYLSHGYRSLGEGQKDEFDVVFFEKDLTS